MKLPATASSGMLRMPRMGGNIGLGAAPAVLLDSSQPAPNCIYANSNCTDPNVPPLPAGMTWSNSINYRNPNNTTASGYAVVYLWPIGGQITSAYSDVNGNVILTQAGQYDPAGSNGWIQLDPQGNLKQFWPGVPPPQGTLSVTPSQASGYSQLVLKLQQNGIMFNAPIALSVGAFVPGTPGSQIVPQPTGAATPPGAGTPSTTTGGGTVINNYYTTNPNPTPAPTPAPITQQQSPTSGGFDFSQIIAWIQQNPMIAAIGGGVIALALLKG